MKIADNFVDYIFQVCAKDKSIRADLRHSAAESMRWRSWSVIAPFVKYFETDSDGRDIFSIIASNIALSKKERNGDVSFGLAMALVEKNDKDKDKLSLRFRRIISSNDVSDILPVLRGALKLIESKGICLDYKELLSDLLVFRSEEKQSNIKTKWISQYLSKEVEIDVPESI